MDASETQILRGLVSIRWIDVAFLIDSAGRLLASAGSSPCFSPTGDFAATAAEVSAQPDFSLYMTAITPGVYLGLVFPADVPIEKVRREVKRAETPLAAAVTQG